MTVAIKDLTLSYGDTDALADVDLTLTTSERFVVMGPSGAGKSTLLRVVAGLERADRGSVVIDDHDVTSLPAHERSVGLMFQDYALFPHLSVIDNVAYGLRMSGIGRGTRRGRAAELLDLVNLGGFGARDPSSLSGGEQQRVALARTLAPGPDLVLFDEPLGSIDTAQKDSLLAVMRDAITAVGAASIYVTHDQYEAESYGDRIAIMNRGAIVRTGTPSELWNDPGTAFVAKFVGHRNVVEGRFVGVDTQMVVVPTDAVEIMEWRDVGGLEATVTGRSFHRGRHTVTLGIRRTDECTLVVDADAEVGVGRVVRFTVDESRLIPLGVDEV